MPTSTTRSLARVLFGAIVFTSVACDSDSIASPRLVPTVFGTYQLETVNGNPLPSAGLVSIVSGEIVLMTDGSMTHRMRYHPSGVNTTFELVGDGMFTVRNDTVAMVFAEDRAEPDIITRNNAVLAGSALTLRWPGAANGQDLVEVFRREP